MASYQQGYMDTTPLLVRTESQGPPGMTMMALLDGPSRKTFDEMVRVEAGRSLQEEVTEAAGKAAQNSRALQGPRVSDLSIQRVLQGFMMPDETMLLLHDMPFESVEIQMLSTDKTRVEERINYPPGHLLLTDRRVLLLSNRLTDGMKIEQKGLVATSSSGFLVTHSTEDAFWYQPLPLKDVKSVTVLAKTQVKTSVAVRASGCKFICMCCTSWRAQEMTCEPSRLRQINLGVTMPPWHNPCHVLINLEPQVPLESIQGFVSQLQTQAKLF